MVVANRPIYEEGSAPYWEAQGEDKRWSSKKPTLGHSTVFVTVNSQPNLALSLFSKAFYLGALHYSDIIIRLASSKKS